MTQTRIYYPNPLKIGQIVLLTGDTFHYLRDVLRMRSGDSLAIFNGQGGEYQATVVEVGKKQLQVMLHSFNPCSTESPLELYLAQGISRGEKMDYTLQKAVECGIKKILPLFMERTTIHLTPERRGKRFQHWQNIIIHACQQSGRNEIPELYPLMDFPEGLRMLPVDQPLYLSPDPNAPRLKDLKLQKNHSILLLIGPEGGLDQKEIDWAKENHFTAVNLGPRILRTETAAVAAITAVQCLLGDMG